MSTKAESGHFVSAEVVAAMLGVTAKHVRRLAKEKGLPARKLPGRQRYEFNIREAFLWGATNLAADGDESVGSTLTDARIRTEIARGEKIERENLLAKRELLVASEVEVTLLAAIAALNARMEGSPGRLSAEVQHKSQAVARRLILEEHRDIRQQFANDLEELAGKSDDRAHLEAALELITGWLSRLKDESED